MPKTALVGLLLMTVLACVDVLAQQQSQPNKSASGALIVKPERPEPFGFHARMTQQEAIAAVGQSAVKPGYPKPAPYGSFLFSLAGFQVIITGRFWVIAEEKKQRRKICKLLSQNPELHRNNQDRQHVQQ
ncbi:MAG TPA: hypothetical protein VJX30_11865 [Terriglobales bacterium]|nr:hypothetical protein [Terriglobales bacterium]